MNKTANGFPNATNHHWSFDIREGDGFPGYLTFTLSDILDEGIELDLRDEIIGSGNEINITMGIMNGNICFNDVRHHTV